jgi:hypothetical protein
MMRPNVASMYMVASAFWHMTIIRAAVSGIAPSDHYADPNDHSQADEQDVHQHYEQHGNRLQGRAPLVV